MYPQCENVAEPSALGSCDNSAAGSAEGAMIKRPSLNGLTELKSWDTYSRLVGKFKCVGREAQGRKSVRTRTPENAPRQCLAGRF